MSDVVIRVENLSKHYRLGLIGGGTLREDMRRWSARLRGRPNPFAPVWHGDIRNPHSEPWALRDRSFEVHQGEVPGPSAAPRHQCRNRAPRSSFADRVPT